MALLRIKVAEYVHSCYDLFQGWSYPVVMACCYRLAVPFTALTHVKGRML